MTFIWYSLAGGAATAVHYAILLVLVEVFTLHPAPSAILGALCGGVVSYLINRWITYPDTLRNHQQAILRFLLVAVVGAALNGALVWTGVHLFVWHYLASQAMATIVVLGLTYRVNSSWTFA